MEESRRRWWIAAAVVIVVAFIAWFLTRGGGPQPPAETPIAAQPVAPAPAPKPEAAPEPRPAAPEPLAVTVLFDFNASAIRPSEVAALDALAAKLKDRPGEGLEIAGYADRIGSDKYNLGLSKRRAQAVRDYLLGKGMQVGAVGLNAMGKAEPATGDKCKRMGLANHRNRKLIECLQPDRRAELKTAEKP